MFGEAKDEVTLEKVDFEWVKSTTKIPRLKKALKLLEQDGGYFQDLMKAITDRMAELDPQYKQKDFNTAVDPSLKQAVKQDVAEWSQQVKDEGKNDIFEVKDDEPTQQAKKKMADNEKNKGNEALRSNDLQEALNYYSKSIQYDPTLAASYCNRALVYLKMKKYPECIKDCDETLKLQPDYIKAFHRRGKANFALKNNLLAYKDFKHILDLEPDNSEVNGELRECRKTLTEDEIKRADNAVAFKKVQIVEEDEEEEFSSKKLESGPLAKELKAIVDLKELATVEIKKGMNMVAVDHLSDGLRRGWKLQEQLNDQQEIGQLRVLRASLLSNIALCYMNTGDQHSVIEYCNTLLEDEQFLGESKDLLIKAYLRRGLAHERLDRLVKGKHDFMKVKHLDPNNLQASKGLDRIQKLMSHEEQSQYQAQAQIARKAQEELQAKIDAQNELKQQADLKGKDPSQDLSAQNHQTQQKPEQVLHQQVEIDFKEVADKLSKVKDQGNQLFKANKAEEAIQAFLNGGLYYEQLNAPDSKNVAFLTYIVLLTNTCLCYSNLGRHKEVVDLASKVLRIDPNNLKASYRRALAYSSQVDDLEKTNDDSLSMVQQRNQLLEQARKDLERVAFLDKENTQAQSKLKEVQQRNIKTRMKLKELSEQQQQTVPKTNNFMEQQEPQVTNQQKSSKVTQNLTRAKLDEIATSVSQTVIDSLLKVPNPENASTFEKNILVFKNEPPSTLLSYLSQIDHEVFRKIYSNKDLPPEILIQVVVAASQVVHEMGGQIQSILKMLSNTKKFDLTIMCLAKKEKVLLREVFEKLPSSQEELRVIYKL